MTRQEILSALRQSSQISVLVVGAGVNGIGTFRDLALQGVDVLLVDRDDFCSGASAASSHMAHGGIRYLENGEFRLVREAVQERNRLLVNAPHYVKPLPTTIPIFKRFSGILNAPLKFFGLLDKPAERGALVIKIGLTLYDAYTGSRRTVPRHRFRSRQGSLAKFPRLNPEILYTATYYDGAILNPERLCVEMILEAESAHDRAWSLNYAGAVDIQGDCVILQDGLNGERVEVCPNIVVNAAGPWIDRVNRAMGAETTFIGGTKGSHLVLDHPELRAAIGEHELFFEHDDGRIVLIFPYDDKVLLGTSDIPIDDPDHALCTDEEVEYFFDMVKKIYPGITVDRDQIVFMFSGVRPLPAVDAESPGQISRDHSIKVLEAGQGLSFPVLSLVGGKWTTFRVFAEQVTDQVLGWLGRARQRETHDLPIGGGRDFPRSMEEEREWISYFASRSNLSFDRATDLFNRYGTYAEKVAGFILEAPDALLRHCPAYSHREISFLVLHEKVVHLDDLLLRRSLLAMLGEVSSELVVELAEIVGESLGWKAETREGEIERTRQIFADHHGVYL